MVVNGGNFSDKILQLVPWIISLLLSTLIILLLPKNLFQKYVTQTQSQIETGKNFNFFEDLDGDGISEWIELGFNYTSDEYPYLMAHKNIQPDFNRTRIFQINLQPELLLDFPPMVDDYDNDGIKEVYLFTARNDSLFLTGINPFVNGGVFVEKFVTIVSRREATYDFTGFSGGLFDLNKDGFKEVVFAITAGLVKNPRKIFAFDIHNDSLTSSPTNYMAITDVKASRDDSLGWFITANNYTSRNVPSQTCPEGFTDYSTWIFVLNEQLEFKFDPIANQQELSTVSTELIAEPAGIFLFVLIADRGDHNKDYNLLKYDINGNLIHERSLSRDAYNTTRYRTIGNKLFVEFSNKGNEYIAPAGRQLEFGKPRKIEPISELVAYDIDSDGSEENITWNKIDKTMVVYRIDFSHLAKQQLSNSELNRVKNISLLRLANGSELIVMQTQGILYFLTYGFNNLYYFKYLFWITIYLLFALSIYALLGFQRRNLALKYERERKIAELELLTIKNQIDPHFIINAINTLGIVIFKNTDEKKQSYQFLVSLSSMIRDTLQNSQKVSLSLKEELAFVENYLQLQQYRFKNSFDFEIVNLPEEIHDLEVPKMIVQTFAENAIKHGLAHKKEGSGKLLITISKTDEAIRIEITDNGIGRKQAAELSKDSTGKGLGIINQIIALYNRLKKADVTYEVIDLYENEKPAGTKIIIRL